MAILRDYRCDNKNCIAVTFEASAKTGETVLCPGCKQPAAAAPVATKNYAIKGDNSASVTPKKHRKEKP